MTFRTRFVALGVLAAAAVATACATLVTRWDAPAIVAVAGAKRVGALIPSWVSWHCVPDAGERAAVLVRDDEWIVLEESFVRYRASDGPDVRIEDAGGVTRLNGDVVCVDLDDAEGRAWAQSASDDEIRALRSVFIDSDPAPDAGALASRIASVAPGADVVVNGSDPRACAVVAEFRPRAVFADDGSGDAAARTFAGQAQVGTLGIEASAPGSLDVLRSFPGLHTLVLSKWNPSATGPLPPGLDGLRRVIVFEFQGANLDALRTAPASLEELALLDGSDLADLTGLERFPHLTTLLVGRTTPGCDLAPMDAIPGLRRAALPARLRQEQFESFLAAHRDLEILEIVAPRSDADLSPLARLPRLRGLVLGSPVDRLDPVRDLRTLRYVGISSATWETSPESVAELRAALPEAVVVSVHPFCLGSGWVLLLVPALGIAWTVRRSVPERA